MNNIETEIYCKLKTWLAIYEAEMKINSDYAMQYRIRAQGYRMGLELVLSKTFLDPILAEFPALWEGYES